MIRVGLSWTEQGYPETNSPYHPECIYPEFEGLLEGLADRSSTNQAYAAVRGALRGLGLDSENFGSNNWNPIGALVPKGRKIVLKPNFIRHWNPEAQGSIESVITHGSVLRAVLDYAFLAAGPEGSVTIAEAPQQDCEFDRIRELVGLDELVRFYRENIGRELRIIDLRREAVVFKDGIIVSRNNLPGDPAGYREVDLGDKSCFANVPGLDPQRFRGADYDPSVTTEHHSGGRHAYLLSETVLSSDLIINIPKLKTHKKTGVTLALKNMVGINGDKNWLPHHSVGSVAQGGDEFPENRLMDRIRSRLTEVARPILSRGIATGLFRFYRRAEKAARGTKFIRAGNWYGNQTTWRMCIDLNRCVYYSDANGPCFDERTPVRKVLTILDGIIAGEGEGPLAPSNVPLGAIIAATDPIGADLVATRLMGFDSLKIPKISESMNEEILRITDVHAEEDVLVKETLISHFESTSKSLNELNSPHVFSPHYGWERHIERDSLGASK